MENKSEFDSVLLRLIAASSLSLVAMQASREMCGKSYFALGVVEKATVDQTAMGLMGSYFHNITLENMKLLFAPQQTLGFHQPSAETPKSPSGA